MLHVPLKKPEVSSQTPASPSRLNLPSGSPSTRNGQPEPEQTQDRGTRRVARASQSDIPKAGFNGEEEYVMPTMNRADVGTSSPEGAWNSPTPAAAGVSDRSMLQVYTIGQLMPKGAARTFDDGNNMGWSFGGGDGTSASLGDPGSGENASSSVDQYSAPAFGSPTLQRGETSSVPGGSSGSQRLRVRRSTLVPGWAVPPRVLLVDDDAVSRRLSSKFLEVFGCAIDVAVDGVGAVNKMNLAKYDLVLMVRLIVFLIVFFYVSSEGVIGSW
jgi:CheY-like chemotaxis protein